MPYVSAELALYTVHHGYDLGNNRYGNLCWSSCADRQTNRCVNPCDISVAEALFPKCCNARCMSLARAERTDVACGSAESHRQGRRIDLIVMGQGNHIAGRVQLAFSQDIGRPACDQGVGVGKTLEGGKRGPRIKYAGPKTEGPGERHQGNCRVYGADNEEPGLGWLDVDEHLHCARRRLDHDAFRTKRVEECVAPDQQRGI